jgi:hypothetical protein
VFILNPMKLMLGTSQPAELNIILDVGQDGLFAPETRAQLIIYDYLQYHDFNVERLDAAENDPQVAQTLETTIQFFTGREGQGPGTPTRLLQLPPALRSPKPAAGNGILAVADLALRRLNGKAEIDSARLVSGPGEHWYVNQLIGNTVQTPDDIVFPIGIRMLMKRDEKKILGQGQVTKDIIGVFGFAKADLPKLEPKRLLAVRLVSTRLQAQFQEGTIIHSSFNKLEHLPKASSFRQRAILVDIAAAQATLKKPGQPSEGATPVSPSSRRANRDLTGMYELQVQAQNVDPNADEYIAPAALFLSQSGQSLVGWYLPYDTIGLDKRFTGAAASLVPLSTRACLVTLKSSKFPLSAPMYWCADTAVDDAVRIDPDSVLATKEFSDAKADVMLMNGKLEVSSLSPLNFSVKLTFREKLPTSDVPGEGEIKTGDAPRVAVFKRVRPGARMAWTVLNQIRGNVFFPQDKIDALIRVSVEPLPSGFRRAVGRLLLTPAMRAQIALFSANRGSATIVSGVFRSVNDQITAITNFFPNPAYRDEARNCVQTQIKVAEVTGVNPARTLEEWLTDIAATHLALQKDIEDKRRVADKQPPMTQEELETFKNGIGNSAPELRDLGLLGGEEFEYEFEFSSQSAGAKLLLGLQVGGFLCTVTRRSTSGVDYALKFAGVFGGVSHALGAGLEIGKGDGSPVSCTIKTFQRIEARDWRSIPPADFTVAAVGAPEGGFENPFFDAKVAVFKSALFTVTVKGAENQREIKLSTVVETDGFFDFDVEAAQIEDFQKRLKDGKIIDVAAELYSITESIGWFIPLDRIPGAPPPTPDVPVIPEQVNPTNQTVNARLMGFAQGSSVVGEREVLTLERRLALYRHLLEHTCNYRCIGFASPEFKEARGQGTPSQANKNLSDDRAKAIDTLLGSCLGDPGAGVVSARAEHLTPFGDGRSSSLRPIEQNGGGLLDPFEKGAEKDAPERVKRLKREADREYPKWRRVDVVVNATLIARIFGK